ncbi:MULTISPECIES: hypothetical protein [Thalassotalea]|uniref:hypothetical protein n=1 Tax=Thalassotalea TaxID=1518149 RepID=UPI0009435691|nr:MULTISPECIES: hypothetical protein [Thalassotalea]OKY27990.1 hypothetical protein BI291_06460 [Thalassotalea sp. PP2-459]
MTGTTMVVLIVLISVGFSVLYDMYKKHIAFKERTLNSNNKAHEQNISLKKQVLSLEERVQVLEKIVTDQGYQVSQEIEKL